MAGQRAIDFNVDARDFHFILKAAKQFDAKLYKGLRARLRLAADAAAADVRREVMQEPKSHAARPYQRGLRAELAHTTKVSIRATESSRKVGVFIETRPFSPAGKALVSHYDNPKGWRHPIFAKKGETNGSHRSSKVRTGLFKRKTVGGWVTQYGRPYFGSVIEKHVPEIEAAVRKALDDAADEIARMGTR